MPVMNASCVTFGVGNGGAHLDTGPLLSTSAMPQGQLTAALAVQGHSFSTLQAASHVTLLIMGKNGFQCQSAFQCQVTLCMGLTKRILHGLTSKSSAVKFSKQMRHMGCVPLALRFMGLPPRGMLELRRPNRLSRWVAALAESGLPPFALPDPVSPSCIPNQTPVRFSTTHASTRCKAKRPAIVNQVTLRYSRTSSP